MKLSSLISPSRSWGLTLGLALVGAVALWFGHSTLDSHASSPAVPPSMQSALMQPPGAPTPAFTDVAKHVTPAVVNITVPRTGEGRPSREQMEEFFGSPWNPDKRPRIWPFSPGEPRERHEGGMGSGVVISPEGHILTNNHVVEGAKELTVTLPDKREFKGKVVGTDPKSDLAVVKVDAHDLPFVTWGDSSKLQVGEYVLAVGNPFGLNSTVTLGIVSALGRGRMGITQYEDFIQTDAAINPGNSGGALVNGRGELVGINTAIISQTGGYQGVGFAVPTTMAKPIYESLVSTGKVVRGYLGIGIQDLTQELAKSFSLKEPKGALISDVQEDSPAEKAGLKQGDVIVKYQGTTVDDAQTLQRLVTRSSVGTKASVTVIRNGRDEDLTVTVGEQPGSVKVAKSEAATDHALAGVEVQGLDQRTARDLGLAGKTQGVLVTNVEPGSPADRAGIVSGDVIREINRKPVKSVQDFEKIASQIKEQDHALLLINRKGASLFISVHA
jgi:serine protease Do